MVASSGNDEFYTPDYAVKPLLEFVPKSWRVWCPFDTDASHIVKLLATQGNAVLASHIDSGTDFFKASLPECDAIISNPPYSKKTEVFERLFALGRPFAMLVGVVGLFEGQRRFSAFSANKFEIMWLDKRVSYLRNYDDEIPALNPPFSSAWITSRLLPQANIFRRIEKPRIKQIKPKE